jgi:hypothetical protein
LDGTSILSAIILIYPRLFIIDGVISLPIAIAGFFVLPDVPEISKAWYFSETVSLMLFAEY